MSRIRIVNIESGYVFLKILGNLYEMNYSSKSNPDPFLRPTSLKKYKIWNSILRLTVKVKNLQSKSVFQKDIIK